LNNLHSQLSHKLFIANIVVLAIKCRPDLTVGYLSGFYSGYVTIRRVFNQKQERVIDWQFTTWDKTSRPAELKIINTVSVESTNIPFPFESGTD
jgi:hypothetical protein